MSRSYRRVEMVGGPFDGERLSLASPPEWLWVEETYGKLRAFRSPTPGREPYLHSSQRGTTSYVYVGHTHTVCRGCGAYHARGGRGGLVVACELCGARLGASIRRTA